MYLAVFKNLSIHLNITDTYYKAKLTAVYTVCEAFPMIFYINVHSKFCQFAQLKKFLTDTCNTVIHPQDLEIYS